MGGKRPDDSNVDPGEAGSSDQGARREGRNLGEQGSDKKKGRSDDDRVDEASEESFPASDPPAQP